MSISRSLRQLRQNRLILAVVVGLISIGLVAAAIGWSLRPPEPPALPATANTTESSEPAQTESQSATDVSGPVLSYSKPVSIRIPAIGLDSTNLMHLGKNDNGSVKVPLGSNTNRPAWYKLGPTPGQIGPAMIMGHVVDENNQPSIFFKLSSLRAGDKVYIPREDGTTATFSITKIKTFAKDTFPTKLVYGPTDHAALRLVTCGGLGENTQLGEYSQNVIAFGKLIDSNDSK